MKKRLLARLLTLVLLLALMPTMALAAEPVATGTCGATGNEDNVTWTLNQNEDGATYTLVISGTGAMADYTGNSTRPWNSYASSITNVVFSEGISHIGARTLQGLTITEVTIPASVTSIDPMGFGGIQELQTITVAKGNTAYKVVDGVLFTMDGKTLVISCATGRDSLYCSLWRRNTWRTCFLAGSRIGADRAALYAA